MRLENLFRAILGHEERREQGLTHQMTDEKCHGKLNLEVQQLNSGSLRSSRDVYGYERAPKDLAPLGAKPGSRIFAEAGKSGCAPTELRSKERSAKL